MKIKHPVYFSFLPHLKYCSFYGHNPNLYYYDHKPNTSYFLLTLFSQGGDRTERELCLAVNTKLGKENGKVNQKRTE